MNVNDSQTAAALEQCKYLWEEYKYRHDLIWQRIFRFTTAVVLLSIIPYIQGKYRSFIWFLDYHRSIVGLPPGRFCFTDHA